ncbi:MAG: PAAR domain-containing protein [Polyangiaceae bacterium]|nr:PAAR domain-containing protein [Polyangiaceae bacterium]
MGNPSTTNPSGMVSQQKAAPPDNPPASPKPLMSNTSGNAVKDATADIVNSTAAPFQNLSNPNASVLDKASGVVGAVAGVASMPTKFLDDAFARATDRIAKALPSFPAATIGMVTIGIPHLHTHPPAMPIPLPGIGPIMTGCVSVLINGIPAARCGDYGIGPTCGSITPVFEIMTGSSKVFIGGQRAARMLDITLQCIPGPPPAVAGAAKAAAAAGKISKAMGAAQKVIGVAGKASQVLGIVSAGKKIIDTQEAADAAQDKEDDADPNDPAAMAEAQGAAASAAAEASAAILAAAMMGADLAMGALAMAMGAMMGKDPGAPPCVGAIILGMPNVLIGGFPMPTWMNLLKGLKKLGAALARGRRGGKGKGKFFCLKCM